MTQSERNFHWPEYLIEAAGLGAFMISACTFGVLLEHPGSALHGAISDATVRRVLMGVAMGLTAVTISPKIPSIPTMRQRSRYWPRLTLGQFIGLCFLGLAALLLALLSIFYAGSRRTILLASEELMRQASRRVTERIEGHLGDAERLLESLRGKRTSGSSTRPGSTPSSPR